MGRRMCAAGGAEVGIPGPSVRPWLEVVSASLQRPEIMGSQSLGGGFPQPLLQQECCLHSGSSYKSRTGQTWGEPGHLRGTES